MKKHATIIISGIVQGVGFRPFIYMVADSLGLNGNVLNMGNAGVKIEIEGEEDIINEFIKKIRSDKPKISSIDDLTVRWSDRLKNFLNFNILKSIDEKGESLVLPPDIAICEECLKDFQDKKNLRFFEYPFIACAQCGPRFTSVIDLPYDRDRTTMKNFPFCPDCDKEYKTIGNRRFHAQTFACRNCGPKFTLKEKNGETLSTKNPIKTAMQLLDEGNIIAIKGIGGIHIACKTTSDDTISKLRKRKKRIAKPFAIMCQDFKTLQTFASPSQLEITALTSFRRPIVLVKKSYDYYLSDLIAPDLDSIGVFLPYSGIHYLLFKYTNEPAIVLTSANRSDEPMIISNEVALRKLNDLADYFLLHDRIIYQRADDSVLIVNQGIPTLIRRSRGYVPQWINTPINIDDVVVALGAEERNTGCILKRGRAYFTQHIGNLTNIDQFEFEISAIKHLMKLTRTQDAKIYSCDLHPQFLSTRLAFELAKEKSAKIIPVQHHFAHAASLMAEHNLKEPIICISCDGFGFGLDGTAWGGEIILSNYSKMERLGHIEQYMMPGGDLCTKYPVRMLSSILSKIFSFDELRLFIKNKYVKYLPYREKELEILIKQLQNKINLPKTTSCGRVLDAISALLDICYVRTYEGEPAMKLEAFARKSEQIEHILEPQIHKINGKLVLNTTILFEELINSLKNHVNKSILAYQAQDYISRGLASIAITLAEKYDIKLIGFSGGVAFNTIFTHNIKEEITKNGLKFIQHRQVPPGDGGISLGQAVIAASKFIKFEF
ncbi:MAG: carbamoyltransferase HypF [Candidatus Helarchaeota archaeon]